MSHVKISKRGIWIPINIWEWMSKPSAVDIALHRVDAVITPGSTFPIHVDPRMKTKVWIYTTKAAYLKFGRFDFEHTYFAGHQICRVLCCVAEYQQGYTSL